MKLNKLISLIIAVTSFASFALTASAELQAATGGTISAIPTAAELAARATKVTTTVTELETNVDNIDFGLFDDFFAPIDVFTDDYRVYKISNEFNVGDLATQMAMSYCGIYSAKITFDTTEAERNGIFADTWGTAGIKASVVAPNGTLSPSAGIDAATGEFNILATITGTGITGNNIYPSAGTYVQNHTITLNAYVVVKADASDITLPCSNAQIVYYAQRGQVATQVSATNKCSEKPASITLSAGGNDNVKYSAVSGLDAAAQEVFAAKFPGKAYYVQGDVISYTSDGTEYYIEATDGTNTAKTKRSIESYLNISEAGVAVKVIPVLVTADSEGPEVTFTKVN